MKCSSDIRSAARATTRWKKLWATACCSSRSRFLREHRRHPDRFVHLQAHEPAEQDVVIELLHQQPLTPNRVEQLQQLRAQEALGRNRRAAVLRVERVEFARHLPQDLVDEGANRPQRVIRRHTLFGGHIAEHRTRLTIVSSHARHGSTRSRICRSPTMRFSATS